MVMKEKTPFDFERFKDEAMQVFITGRVYLPTTAFWRP